MAENYVLGAYWGASEERPAQIAQRLIDSFHQLRKAHPAFDNWRDSWRNEQEWLAGLKEPWTLDPATLEAKVTEAAIKDDNGKPIAELGYSIVGWNGGWDGDEEAGIALHLSAGNHAKTMSPNSIVLNLTPPRRGIPGLYDPTTITKALTALVRSWHPMWATFTSTRLLDAQRSHDDGAQVASTDANLRRKLGQLKITRDLMPTVGWLTFLHRQTFSVIPSDLGSTTIVTEDHQGWFINIGEDPLTVSDDEAVALHKRLVRPFRPRTLISVTRSESFNFDRYRERVAGAPTGVVYKLNGYEFHAYRDSQLHYVHDETDLTVTHGEISADEVSRRYLPLAREQLRAAQDVQIVWWFPQFEVAWGVQEMLGANSLTGIIARYSPA